MNSYLSKSKKKKNVSCSFHSLCLFCDTSVVTYVMSVIESTDYPWKTTVTKDDEEKFVGKWLADLGFQVTSETREGSFENA